MNIGIQGIKGAFHEEAAIKYFGNEIQIQPQLTFSELVDAVMSGEIDKGIMAVENTISGTIHSNLGLIRKLGLQIVGEEYLKISQNLVALPGTKIEDLKQISSHYMAINQCRNFLDHYPSIKLIEAEDTAIIMRQIAENKDDLSAAIGSNLAADYYGLEVIQAGIETNKNNYTRFLVVQKDKTEQKSFNKSSVSLKLNNKKGCLSQVLSVIAFYDIDLSKIESLPIIGEPWNYRFYIDLLFESELQYRQMLTAIKPLIHSISILGEYNDGSESLSKIHRQK